MNTSFLKECPFCGGNARVIRGQIYMSDVYTVECDICNAHGLFEFTAQKGRILNHPDRVVTDKQAIQKAVDYWNNRKAD